MTMTEYNLRRLAVVLKDSIDAITVQDLNGTIKAWNKGAENLYGYTENEALGMLVKKLMIEGTENDEVIYIEKISKGERVEPFETQRVTKYGTIVDVLIVITCLYDDSGEIDSIATTERDITALKNKIRQKENEVKVLKGLLPICSHCKEIRDDEGYWHQIESYIKDHSDAEFSHGICPKCAKKYYPDLNLYK